MDLGSLGLAGANLLELMTPQGVAVGTGILEIVHKTGSNLPPALVDATVKDMPGLLGGYPGHKDIAPSAIFIAVFGILCLGHSFVYFKNRHFYPSLGLAIYAFFKVLGFGLRVKWAHNVLLVQTGIASTCFSLVSVLYLNIMTVLLANRILEARAPGFASRWYVRGFLITTYVLVIGVIVMAIVGQSIPYVYFLSPKHYTMCLKVVEAAAILNVLYAATPFQLVSFSLTSKLLNKWFPVKNGGDGGSGLGPDVEKATDLHENNSSEHLQPVAPNHLRITHVQGLHIVGCSILLTFSACLRCLSTFRTQHPQNWVYDRTVFYVTYGALEAIVNIIYLVFRIQDHFNY